MSKKVVIERWTEIENGCISNVPRGKSKPPDGKPLEYFLFAWDVEVRQLKDGQKEFAKRRMITVTADDDDDMSSALERVIADQKLRLVKDGSRDLSGARTHAYGLVELAEENGE